MVPPDLSLLRAPWRKSTLNQSSCWRAGRQGGPNSTAGGTHRAGIRRDSAQSPGSQEGCGGSASRDLEIEIRQVKRRWAEVSKLWTGCGFQEEVK